VDVELLHVHADPDGQLQLQLPDSD
jgi:hypothetical protein